MTKTSKKATTKKLSTDITVILDRSGSMEVIRKDTIGGFNTFLKDQKAVDAPAVLTLAQFDTIHDIVHDAKDIQDVPELDEMTFVPRGGTALYDAIGRGIGAAVARQAKAKTDKVVIVIITDGMNNASREFELPRIKEMIDERTKDGWEFVFLAANQDAFSVGGSMGISGASTMNYAANGAGTQAMFSSTSANLSSLRSGDVKNMAYSDADRKKQAEAGVK